MRRFIALALTVAVALSVAACTGGFRRGDEGVSLDPNRTWIYVGNYDGGLGHDWLQTVIDGFMEENPDWGIYIDNDKDNYSDKTLYNNIETNRQSLYFVNSITYPNYVAGGKLKDITDIVTEKLPGEEKSIEDKMNPALRDYYKVDEGGGGGTTPYRSLTLRSAPSMM